ncbi:MAG TPA: hypothetical protein VF101_11870 [Gaiellaceae bacterium]
MRRLALLLAAAVVVAGDAAAPGNASTATVHFGGGSELRRFVLREPPGVILVYRLSAPRAADVRATVQIPGVTVPLRIATRPTGPSSECTTSRSRVTCTVGEEWCPMPRAAWKVRLEKRAGPAGPVILTFRVGTPPA